MSHDERVDVIDFIINVLKEHEKNLDTQLTKLEDIITFDRMPRPSQERPKRETARVKVALKAWEELYDKGSKSEMLAFTMSDDRFEVSALKNNVLYIYSEKIPEVSMTIETKDGRKVIREGNFSELLDNITPLSGRLKCGIPIEHRKVELKLPDGSVVQKIVFEADNEIIKTWLSKQLEIEKDSIIVGTIDF